MKVSWQDFRYKQEYIWVLAEKHNARRKMVKRTQCKDDKYFTGC